VQASAPKVNGVGLTGKHTSTESYERAAFTFARSGLVAVKVKNVPMGQHQVVMDYMVQTLHWPLDPEATQEMITICPSRDGSLCWFFVWMPRDHFAGLNFVNGVFDLTHSPTGQDSMDLSPFKLLHVEEDFLWGATGHDVDALVEKMEEKWRNPDREDEVEITQKLHRISIALQAALNLNFTPCARRRFRPESNSWILVLTTMLKEQDCSESKAE
jgi:hypothetical protein